MRAAADLVIVALHKGIVHTPAVLAPYERPLAAAALEAGADVVVGHHAHMLRGIERSDGRPVFHGLGNACVVTRALDPGQDHPARAAWAKRRRELFGFEPDPRYPLAPFHPEAVHGILGIAIAHADGRLSTGVVPLFSEPPGRPVCVRDDRADAVIAYLERIGAAAGSAGADVGTAVRVALDVPSVMLTGTRSSATSSPRSPTPVASMKGCFAMPIQPDVENSVVATGRTRPRAMRAAWPSPAPSARRSSGTTSSFTAPPPRRSSGRASSRRCPLPPARWPRSPPSAPASSPDRSAASSWGTSATASAASRCSSGR